MTAPYTAAELAAILARAEKATAGPWHVYPDHQRTVCIEQIAGTVEFDCPSTNDALFVAHARTDVPRLVADLTRAREALQEHCMLVHPAEHQPTSYTECLLCRTMGITGEFKHEPYCVLSGSGEEPANGDTER